MLSEELWPLNGLLNYYTILLLKLLCERAGGNDEIPYTEAFMLLHQEEKKSDGCSLMVQQYERKPKGKSVLQEGKGENESEDMLLQNLNSPPADAAVPAAVLTTPVPPIYSLLLPPPVSPTYGDQLEVSMLNPRAYIGT